MAEKKIVDLVIRDNVQETESHLKDLTSQINASKKSVDGLEQSFEGLNNVAIDLDATFEEVYGDLKPLTARMGEAEDRLYELSLAGKQGTAEFQALLTTVGNYRKVQIQTDLAVDSAATTMTQKLGGSLEYVSGAFAATQGALAIFGKENADVEKAILKVQSALAITQGFAAMREGANSVKQLGTAIKSLTIFQTAYNFINTATTTGLKALRIALVSTGIGAIVIGVGLLIANFDKLKKVALNLVPSLGKVGDTIGNLFNSFTDFVGITSKASREMQRMQENADKSLKNNAKFLKEHGSQIDQYTKSKIDAVNEYNEALKEDGANQVALQKELNRKLAKIDKERSDADNAKAKEKKDKEEEKNKEAKDRLDAYNKSIKDAIKAYNNEIEDIEADNEQKQLDLWKKRQTEEINLLAKNTTDKNNLLLALERDYLAKQKVIKDASNKADEEVFRKFENGKAKIVKSSSIDTTTFLKNAMDKSIQNAKENADAEIEIEKQKKIARKQGLNEYAILLGQASNLLGESTDEGKAAAIAATTISTYLAAQQAYASQMAIPTPDAPFRAVLAAGLAIASGLKNVQSIIDVQTPNGGGGGATPAAESPRAPTFNVVGASPASANQIAQSVGGNQAPLKAYVVAQDVTTQQALNRNIVTSASLG
jgi:hypothetical protein